jgi:hypothetical protein
MSWISKSAYMYNIFIILWFIILDKKYVVYIQTLSSLTTRHINTWQIVIWKTISNILHMPQEQEMCRMSIPWIVVEATIKHTTLYRKLHCSETYEKHYLGFTYYYCTLIFHFSYFDCWWQSIKCTGRNNITQLMNVKL